MIDRTRLRRELERERTTFAERNPRSAKAYEDAAHLLGRVPMTWMNKRAGGFPLYLAAARGARVTDVDGHEYVDLCLGDTGAMAGHSPPPVVEAVRRRIADEGGLAAMMPTEDAAWVGAELASRFGLPYWSFSLTATDANRWAMRLARALTDRPKILFNAYCYHGSVDESLIVLDGAGRPASRPGNVGAPCDVLLTSRVAEFNDVEGLDRELAHGDVAAVLMEPALTNVGIVLPEPGYLQAVRELTSRHGTLLILDETHTFSAGPGGATGLWGLRPDVVTIGKSIAGGVPCGAYGLSNELADRALGRTDLDLVDMGGVGGTLAGNPVSMAAARACLADVLTDSAFARMTALTTRLSDGLRAAVAAHGLPWSVSQLGARVEYRFADPAPRNGTASNGVADPDLDDFLHVFAANRGVLLTPFHNMALTCPETTAADVDLYRDVFAEALNQLMGEAAVSDPRARVAE
jgi:glutamate-1-semialdehyde 2,1-aminomutase